jgi:hypothetical protein
MTVDAEDRLEPPTEARGFLAAAESMLAGAKPLLKVAPIPVVATTLLCGHGTEAALKAILAQTGLKTAVLSKPPYGHDLLALWESAHAASGAALPIPRPQWVEHLHRVHAAPYHLRYPLGFHAIVLPNQELMITGLELLVGIARKAVY